MMQAIHILKKDVWHLRYEIGLTSILSLLYGWAQGSVLDRRYPYAALATVLLYGAVMLTLSQAIHAEALPGDKQFWLTRPYRWQSLLGAKVLFIVLCLNLPVLIGRVLIVAINDIPLLPALSGLLWTQLWLFLVFVIPAAALGTVTTGVAPFVFAALGILAAMRGIFEGLRLMHPWPRSIEWIRDLITLVAVTAVGAFMLLNQYRSRDTRGSRTYGALGMMLVIALYAYLPLGFGFEAQHRLSSPPPEASSIQVRVAPQVWIRPNGSDPGEPTLTIAVEVTDVPDVLDVRIEGFSINLAAPDGRTWNSGPVIVETPLTGRRSVDFGRLPERMSTTDVPLDPSFFQQERDKMLAVSGSVYFTVFGNPREKTVRFPQNERFAQPAPAPVYVNVIDDLRCNGGYVTTENQGYLICRSVSELSKRLVSIRSGEQRRAFHSWLSYAPFGLGTDLAPVVRDSTQLLYPETGEVTIIVQDPVAHERRDFQFSIRLDDVTRSK